MLGPFNYRAGEMGKPKGERIGVLTIRFASHITQETEIRLWRSAKPTRIVSAGITLQERNCKRLNELSVFRSHVRRNLSSIKLREIQHD